MTSDGQPPPHAGASSLPELLSQMFDRADALGWMSHRETGQVVWASSATRRAMARASSGPAQALEPQLLTAEALIDQIGAQGEIGTRALTIDQDDYVLFVVHLPLELASGAGRLGAATRSAEYWQERHGLTPTLAQVAALLARRASTAEIAAKMAITAESARTYVKRVYRRIPPEERAHLRRRVSSLTEAPAPPPTSRDRPRRPAPG